MLYGIVAKPGQGKSYFAVTKMYDMQQVNIENIKKNVVIYYENKQILEDRDLLKKDYTFKYELGEQTHEKTTNYKYYEQLEDEEQFEEYFEYFFYYNHYIDQIRKEEGINLTNILPVRQIYSDINGLKIDGVLPCDIDWRKTPMGSVHFIDEVRKKPPYKFESNAPSKDPIIIEMAMVRHTDKDVWLITQDAKDYNVSLRQLIDKMYFVKRPPQNPQACGIYVFDQWLNNPRAAADSTRDPKKYVEHFILPYKKKFQRMYTSASSHTSMKFRIPWKVFAYALLFIAIVTIVLVGFLNIPIFNYFGNAIRMMAGKDDTAQNLLKPELGQNKNQSKTEQNGATGLDERTDQERREDFEKEIERVRYNINQPYEFDATQYNYEIKQVPILAGCMIMNNTCNCYTQQATKIDMSQKDCKRYMNGDKPFNPFLDARNNQNQQQTMQNNQFVQQQYQPVQPVY